MGFGIGARDIAAIGCAVAERDRTADHDRHVIALPEMADTDACRGIADIAGFGEAYPRSGRTPLGGKQRKVGAVISRNRGRLQFVERRRVEAIICRSEAHTSELPSLMR